MKKVYDSRDRRIRWVDLTPEEQKECRDHTSIRPADLKILAYANMIGGVGVNTKLHYFCGSHTDQQSFEKRLTKLKRAGYLSVGWWQRRTDNPEANPLIRSLTKDGKTLLKDAGMYVEKTPEASGAPYHDAFQGHVYASSIERAKQFNFYFETQHELLTKYKRGTHIDVDGVIIKPDLTTRFTTPNRTILVFDEIDRASQPNRRIESVGKSWQDPLPAYFKLIEEKKYKELFPLDVKNYAAILRIWTIDQRNLESILRFAQELNGKPMRYVMGRALPCFGIDFHPPIEHIDVYNEPFETAGSGPYILRDA